MKINAIAVPEGAGERLEQRFAARKHAIDDQPGFEGFQLLRPVKGESRYFVVTRWTDDESYQNWWSGQGRAAHGHGDEHARTPVASSAELLEFDVVLDSLDEDRAGREDGESRRGQLAQSASSQSQ